MRLRARAEPLPRSQRRARARRTSLRQVLPGEGTFAERLATTCANASEELTQRGELHGYVLSSLRDGAEVERALLPVISMTKIAGCHGDLVAPPWYHSQHLAGLRRQPEGFWAYARRLVGLGGWGAGSPGSDADPDALPWEQRVPRLFFRGSTTGGGVKVGTPYERFHRHRLVELAANDSRMDIGFTNFLQARAPVPIHKYGVLW